MKKRKGITLIALVVTIIVLLILVGVTISFTVGSNGIIERTKNSKVDSRYGTIMDKIKVRETDLKIAFARKEEGEHQENFINRMIAEGLITADDDYDDTTYRTIYLGKQSDGSYKYTINVADGTSDGKDIADMIDALPDADAPGNEYLKNMTLIIKTTKANHVIELPISNSTGLTINWNAKADPNNFVSPNRTVDPSFTYPQMGEYEVRIKGESEPDTIFGKENYYGLRAYIVQIKYWGENGFSEINAFGQNFEGIIPVPSRNSFEKVTAFDHTFCFFYNITEIPVGLFANCPNVTTFNHAFYDCNSLIKIPKGLFANCPNVTYFHGTFSGCNNLVEIPKGLFADCSNVMNFGYVFYDCYSLREISKGLFTNCINVRNFNSAFYNCNTLTEIPIGLFDDCILVEDFNAVFNFCESITSIPEGLFKKNINAHSFSESFGYCISLKRIPPNLFENNLQVEYFIATFNNCTNLTGYAPDLWERIPEPTGSGCFFGCTKLTNYSIIPYEWKKDDWFQ